MRFVFQTIKKIFLSPLVSRAAIKPLLKLHTRLYSYIGACAVACEGGVHPKHRLTRYHDFFIGNIGPEDTVLDVGCGNGQVLLKIASKTRGASVGVDISPENIQSALKRLKDFPTVGLICSDIWQYKEKRHFDVIVMSNVLEHLRERPALLKYLADKFHPQYFLIRIPMFERDWLIPYKKEMGVEWRLDNTHEIEYTESEIIKELSAAGLAIETVEFRWSEMYIKAVLANG